MTAVGSVLARLTSGRSRIAGGWNRFWFAEVDARPFGLVRIAVALAGLQLWLGTLPLLREFYTDAGQFTVAEARGWSGEWAARLLMPDVLGSYPVVVVLFCLSGVALLALLVGWRTRVAAWATWVLTLWFFYRNPTFVNGGDEVLRLATLYLAAGFTALQPIERAYSLDRRRALSERGMRNVGEPVDTDPPRMPAWPVRLLQVQLCLIYVVSGFWKVVAPAWWDGTALVYALGNSAFSRFGVPSAAWLRAPFTVVTVAIAWWELLFPLLVTWGRSRRAALLFGVLLHGMILLTMNIGVFPFIMIALYPAFLRPGEAERIVRAARAAAGRVAQLPGRSVARRKSAASSASS